MVFLSDEYLKIKSAGESDELKEKTGAMRFFSVASQLPMDLQMVLCNRTLGSAKALILTKNSEPAFVNLAKIFVEEDQATAIIAAS